MKRWANARRPPYPPTPLAAEREATEPRRLASSGFVYCGDHCLNHGILQNVTMICVGPRSLMATVVSIGSRTILPSSQRSAGTTVRTKLRLRNRFPNTAMEIFGRSGKMRVG
jgi:hypothetical protein